MEHDDYEGSGARLDERREFLDSGLHAKSPEDAELALAHHRQNSKFGGHTLQDSEHAENHRPKFALCVCPALYDLSRKKHVVSRGSFSQKIF